MKLLLTSAGLTNSTIQQKFLELCEGKKKNILYIITAGKAVCEKPWLIQNLNDFSVFGGIDVIDLAGLEEKLFLEKLDWAEVIVFGGGDTSYLLSKIYEKGYQKHIITAVKKGKIYVGMSAGSIAACDSLWTASECIFDISPENAPKGLGLTNISFRPHLNAEKFPKIREEYLRPIFETNKIPFYALDDDSAILIHDEVISVISEGNWKKFS